MAWAASLAGFGRMRASLAEERERARQRLLEQERRFLALSRAVEVIQRSISEESHDDAV